MRNIEIKAILNDPETAKSIAKQLSSTDGKVISQTDTFYNVPSKNSQQRTDLPITNEYTIPKSDAYYEEPKPRLKIREFQDGHGEVICYERKDTEGPKLSSYTKTELKDPKSCRKKHEELEQTMGRVGIVKKERLLFIIGQSRIHIDQVVDLGNFIEIEVVLDDNQDIESGIKISEELMNKFGIETVDLISMAYIDMLLKKK